MVVPQMQLSSVGGRPLMQTTMGGGGSVPTIKLAAPGKALPSKVAITAGEARGSRRVLQQPSQASRPQGIQTGGGGNQGHL